MGIFDALKKTTSYTVTMKDGTTFEVPAKSTILQAGLDAGLAYPHRCRVGSCTTCKTQIIEGKVKELTDSAYVLTNEDISSNMVLACQCVPKSDLAIDVTLGDNNETAAIPATIRSTRFLTHDICEVVLRLKRPIHYRAGQYADIQHEDFDRPRSYSFATKPASGGSTTVTFHIRKVAGGQFTEWLFAKDRTSSQLHLVGPLGEFGISDTDSPMLCIAGGSGMAPLKSILEEAVEKNLTRDIVYLYGARTQNDLYCLHEMKEIEKSYRGRFSFVPVLSEESEKSDWQGARGMVTEEITRQGLDLARSEAYLCGPPPMIDAAIAILEKNGMSDNRIYFDKFLDASHLTPARA